MKNIENNQLGLERASIQSAGEVPGPVSGEMLHEETVPVHSRIWVSAADGATAILCSIAEGAALT